MRRVFHSPHSGWRRVRSRSVLDRLTTERLVLRRWTTEDRRPFAELNSDPEVMRFFPRPLTREESDALVVRIEEGFEQSGFGLWAVEVGKQFAGYTGLKDVPFDTPMGPHVEIGWRFARWAWGQGYATEAAECVMAAAFEIFALSDVYSYSTESNSKSEAVMKRIGMVRRADLDFDHPNTPGWWGARHIVYHSQPSVAGNDRREGVTHPSGSRFSIGSVGGALRLS